MGARKRAARHRDHIELGAGGDRVRVGLKEDQAGLRFFEACGGPISLRSDTRILV